MQRDVTPQYTSHGIPQWTDLMSAAVPSQLSTALHRYKRDSDKNYRRNPKFKVGKYMFVDRSQLGLFASDAADKLACRLYKLLKQTSGAYRFFSVQPHTVAIGDYSISNTVFTDILRLSFKQGQMTSTPTWNDTHNRDNTVGLTLTKCKRRRRGNDENHCHCTKRIHDKSHCSSCG